MAGGKETPRQKMIGIMYLVLMAMLALNVSDTILNAFSTLNESLQTSTSNVNTGLQQSLYAFEATKMKENPDRARPILEKAKEAQKIAGELNLLVESLKKDKGGEEFDPAARATVTFEKLKGTVFRPNPSDAHLLIPSLIKEQELD